MGNNKISRISLYTRSSISFSNKNPLVGSAQVKASGELPTSGKVTINEDGTITAKNLKFGKYICSTIKSETDKTIDPNNMVCVKSDGTPETYDGIIYARNTKSIRVRVSKITDLESTETAEPYYESVEEVMSASGKAFFNKYTVVDDVITEGYACQTFGKFNEPICIQGGNESYYNYENTPGNWAVLNALNSNQTFTSAGGACRFSSSRSACQVGSLELYANSDGYAEAYDLSTCAASSNYVNARSCGPRVSCIVGPDVAVCEL